MIEAAFITPSITLKLHSPATVTQIGIRSERGGMAGA